jgi:phosphoglycolate phosphatase
MTKENHLNCSHVIYIGDETRDIIAAQKAGIRSVAVTWGYNSHKALKAHHPDHLIHSPQALLQLLE